MLDTGNFGPYRIVKRLGVGGMAETFEATRKGPGGFEQRVCLKRVLPAFSENQEFVDQFQHEARLAAQLRHSNIVSIIDFGREEEVHYMALELVDGVDLRSLLAGQPEHKLSSDVVALIGLDLAYALDYAHSLCGQIAADGKLASGIVHRDVSPANVLISRSGEVKLADFGIAKVINNTVATATGTIRGKIPYMAPEQMKGLPTDGRADLFSLGVMLFEGIAGRRPFEGQHDVEVMTHILDNTRLRLENIAPDTPEKLKIAINNLIEHDRDRRTPDANALIDQLANTTHIMRARRELAEIVEARLGGSETREHIIYAAGPDDETGLADDETEEGVSGRLKETELMGDESSFDFMATTAERPSTVNREDTDSALQLLPTTKKKKRRSLLAWTLPLWMAMLSVAVAVMYFSSRTPAPPKLETTKTANSETKSNKTEDQTKTTSLSNTDTQVKPLEDDVVQNPDSDAAAKQGKKKNKAERTRTTDANKSQRVPASDSQKEAYLKVSAFPWANYWVDGKYYGRASNLPIPLKPGRHTVGAGRSEDKPEITKGVTVRAGEPQSLSFTLDVEP